MARHPVHVAIDSALFMSAHLVGNDAGRIVDLWKSGRARRSADIFPSRAAVAAARHAALFDADDDFIRHARVERDGARMRHMRAWGKGPFVVIRQAPERR